MIKLENDARVLKVDVLRRVAKLAFDHELTEDAIERIPHEMVPTSQPHFRCCVYKEREILRGRTRLAMGKKPLNRSESTNVIHVLSSACEGCPINRYRVTENCQKCLAKKCMNACPFGAISMTGRGAYIDPDKCKECGRCAQACPYNAIADLIRPCRRACPVNAISLNDDKIAVIEDDKCISCGACMRDCPFGAISDVSSLVEVIDAMEKGPVYAIVAPALEGQFGMTATMGHIKSALVKLGFAEALEVGLGADAVAQHESEELMEALQAGRKMTTSCCPAFVNMIKKHFPQLLSAMSHTVSPMVALSRLIRADAPRAKVVFIGPCVAKKTETDQEGGPDYVLTSEELLAMFQAQGIDPEKCEPAEQDSSIFGKNFAVSGGVTGAVMQAISEVEDELPSVVCHRCDGAAECKKALAMLTSGKFNANFIEGMACEGGCSAGPTLLVSARQYKQARTKLLAKADARGIHENVERAGFHQKVDMNRSR